MQVGCRPAGIGCDLVVRFWGRATSTETSRGDYLNMGLGVTGQPPKTRYSFAFDQSPQWQQYSAAAGPGTGDRTATITFHGSEGAGNGVTTFDIDDVTATLQPAVIANM